MTAISASSAFLPTASRTGLVSFLAPLRAALAPMVAMLGAVGLMPPLENWPARLDVCPINLNPKIQQKIKIKKPMVEISVSSTNSSESCSLMATAIFCREPISISSALLAFISCFPPTLLVSAALISCMLISTVRPINTKINALFKSILKPVPAYCDVILNGQLAIRNGISAPTMPSWTTASII